MRASTGKRNSAAFSALISNTTAAPSLSDEALPAVTVPSLRNAGRSRVSASRLVSRGCSSCLTSSASPFGFGTVTGVISCAKRPACCAACAFCCERSAKLSCSARLMAYFSARFSAVMPMW